MTSAAQRPPRAATQPGPPREAPAMTSTDIGDGRLVRPPVQRPQIRGLSLQQPYAAAIARGGKDIENRTNIRNWRGWVAIHASLKPYPNYDDQIDTVVELSGLPEAFVRDAAQVRGKIVAVARLTGSHGSHACVRTAPLAHLHPDGRYTCSKWATGGNGGTIHLALADVMPLPDPVPCRGALMFWQVPPPVLDQVVAQLPGGALPPLPGTADA